MDLTLEQITDMAPDERSAAAGRKLMAVRNWQDLGCHAAALWGRCRGSAVYDVRIDLKNFGYSCSCPSRKFPCKHVLGRLMLQSTSPDAVEESEPPEWVEDWLSKRQARIEKQASKAESSPKRKPADPKARARRVARRAARVQDGIERLDLWLRDLIRNGIADLESRPMRFWDETAQRLVDDQAQGLAGWIRRLSAVPGSGRDWPARLLAELGRLKLALRAYSRLDELAPGLQADVRQLIGWTVAAEELAEQGERVEDEWIVYGQTLEDDERLRTQRSWAVGRQSGRTALVLQFAAGRAAFAEQVLPGSRQQAELVFYPGACPQRARFVRRSGELRPIVERLPGAQTIDAYLAHVGELLAQQPWLSNFGCVLQDVQIVAPEPDWLVVDRARATLPLAGRDHWTPLALSGGQPCDIAGEWNGHRLRLHGVFYEGSYHVV